MKNLKVFFDINNPAFQDQSLDNHLQKDIQDRIIYSCLQGIKFCLNSLTGDNQ